VIYNQLGRGISREWFRQSPAATELGDVEQHTQVVLRDFAAAVGAIVDDVAEVVEGRFRWVWIDDVNSLPHLLQDTSKGRLSADAVAVWVFMPRQ